LANELVKEIGFSSIKYGVEPAPHPVKFVLFHPADNRLPRHFKLHPRFFGNLTYRRFCTAFSKPCGIVLAKAAIRKLSQHPRILGRQPDLKLNIKAKNHPKRVV